MGLMPRKNPAAAAAPTAETASAPAAAAAPAATSAPTPAPTAAPTAGPAAPNLPAASGPRAVGAVASAATDILKDTFKDKVALEWNTLNRIQANQGNFLNLEKNKEAIGSTLIATVISFQDNFQISPGTDNDEDAKYVRYSNDGITTTEGENCLEFLQALKDADYADAKMSPRCTMALAIEDVVGKPGHPLIGELVQIDLSKTSKDSWDRFRLQTSFKMSRGMIPQEKVLAGRIKMEANTVTKGKLTWTMVNFSLAD